MSRRRRPVLRMLRALSMQLDWDHWDCWAVVHEGCDPMPCEVCGGCRCVDIDVVEDVEPVDVSRETEESL
jgi:hypothetical protein